MAPLATAGPRWVAALGTLMQVPRWLLQGPRRRKNSECGASLLQPAKQAHEAHSRCSCAPWCAVTLWLGPAPPGSLPGLPGLRP